MKSKILTALCLMLICTITSFAGTTPTVRHQLEDLNKYWRVTSCNYAELNKRVELSSDVPLIQMHLMLVERFLRETTSQSLSPEQKENRLMCLDILHTYCLNGVFPKNLYHSVRTPYFIDDFGTACAVGQLVISSGYAHLARKISSENNYAYIEDMNYPELLTWADKFGFTLRELEWIQPSYGCFNPGCGANTQRNISCSGGYDGCLGMQQPTSLTAPPFQYDWSRYNTVSGMWDGLFQTCDLNAGLYKCHITDSLGSTEDQFFTLIEPDPLVVNVVGTSDDGTCSGSALVYITGGTTPYTYYWMHNGSTAGGAYNLCQGTYHVIISDLNGCSVIDSVVIDFGTGILNNVIAELTIGPNPASDKLIISTNRTGVDPLEATVFDLSGRVVKTGTVEASSGEINISDLKNGIYTLSIKGANDILKQRFVKYTN